MRVTVIAAGSRGDIQPYLALAAGLKQRGFDVRFGTNINFEGLARQYDLPFAPIGVDSYREAQSEKARAWLESTSTIKLAVGTLRVVRPILDRLIGDVFEICQDSDLLVYHSFTVPYVYHFSRHLGIPALAASIYPLATSAHPALSLNPPPVSSPAINRFTHFMVDAFGWQVFSAKLRSFLQNKGGKSTGNAYRKLLDGSIPVICGYSPQVIPGPPDLGSHVRITGYWFLEPTSDWQPDPALVAFIQAGDRPVFAGFGSMGNPTRQQETTSIIVQAARAAGRRVILVGGWSDLGAGQAGAQDVFATRSVPFDWLFPQMAAIVHHGGAGTTSLALRAGVPNVVVPHFADNHFWARRVHDLGAGPAPIPRKQLTVEKLAAALSQAVTDEGMQVKARRLGKNIQAEDGISAAVEEIRRIMG